MPKKSSAIADQVISLSDAAAVTGYSTTWILKLVERGKLKKLLPGKYRLGDVIQGCIEAKADNSSFTAARERVLKARAEAMEIKNLITCKTLVEIDESLLLIDRVLMPLKQDLIGLGARVTRDQKLRVVIDNCVKDILQVASDRSIKMGKELKSDIPANEPDPDQEFFSEAKP